MALVLPPNWCLLFFPDPEEKFTTARLKQVLAEHGFEVHADEQPFEIHFGDGLCLAVSMRRGSHVETMVRGLVGKRRKHRLLIPGCDTEVKIELSDVEAVLDEINTLIEVQAALQEATQGLMYMSWNQNFVGPTD